MISLLLVAACGDDPGVDSVDGSGSGLSAGTSTQGEDAGSTGGGAADGEGSTGVDDGAEPTPPGDDDPLPPPADCSLDSAKRAPVKGLPDWTRAGYRGGEPLPTEAATTVLAIDFGVVPDDGEDDSAALQAAIDSVSGGSYDELTELVLPPGQIDLSEEIHVDRSFLIIRGAGYDPAGTSTRIVVRPSPDMAYPGTANGGTEPDIDGLDSEGGRGRWLWPGRGAFRVQTRQVHSSYASGYASAPDNRRDIFEGTINVHWKSGLEVDQDLAIAAQRGDTQIPIDSSDAGRLSEIEAGQLLWVGAANTTAMFDAQGVLPEHRSNSHMRAQVFEVVAVDLDGRMITIDRPLEFDLPANSIADGSAPIDGDDYPSRVVPLVVVEGVGFEDFYLTYDLEGLPRPEGGTVAVTAADAEHEYGNLVPEFALHGIVFKWAAHSWVRNVQVEMAGSHPIVTEVAKNLRVERVLLRGSWNKGKGGHGYFRGSRVWDSVFGCSVSRGLRHFTLQWSSSGNVVYGNDFDSDLNLHGGWERHNLFEANVVRVPRAHSSGNCSVGCGDDDPDEGTWYPIWWGAGAKAGKWSGATGPQNVFYRNVLTKQVVPEGPYEDYAPYYAADGRTDSIIFQLGWSRETPLGSQWEPLSIAGEPIADWQGHETVDFSAGDHTGVNARQFAEPSLYLID